ncbi:MAG: hypothetical protein M1313_01055 [Nitrospirae bacterium]|nr:hypothetical protein [Nitrospirota bacterium]
MIHVVVELRLMEKSGVLRGRSGKKIVAAQKTEENNGNNEQKKRQKKDNPHAQGFSAEKYKNP